MDSKQCEIDLKSVTPLQGFFIRLSVIPGRRCALPWANMLRPFRQRCEAFVSLQNWGLQVSEDMTKGPDSPTN